MGLETATYINQLVPSNPLGTDLLSQADDHIRLLKTVLQNSFPKDLRDVSSPSNGVPLRYNGTSFRNYNNGYYTNLEVTQNLTCNSGFPTTLTYQNELQDDLNIYSGSGSDLVIPANFPVGAFGVYFSLVCGIPSNVPNGGYIQLELINVTSTSRNPMRGAAQRFFHYIIPPSTNQPQTLPHFSGLLFMQPHNNTRVNTGDVLRVQVTYQNMTGNIVNGNVQAFVL
jgi:hypothetical protein